MLSTSNNIAVIILKLFILSKLENRMRLNRNNNLLLLFKKEFEQNFYNIKQIKFDLLAISNIL